MTVLETGQIMMDILVTAYPRFYAGKDAPDPKKTLELWATMFAEYPLAVVAGAVKALIATDEKGFPPHIGAVMAKIRQLTQDKPMTEQEALALVKKAVSRSGYNSREEFDKLPPEIQAVLHDAGTLKAWAIDENYNEGVVSSNFMRSYRAKAQSIREWNALPEDVKRIAIDAGGGFALPEPVKAAEWKRRLAEGRSAMYEGKHFVSARASIACPYYIGDDCKRTIRCEGPIEGTTLDLQFRHREDKIAHFRVCCGSVTGHRACEIFRIVNEKYYPEGEE